MIKTMRWLLGTVVGFLALVSVGAAATHYLYEPTTPAFSSTPPSWRCTWSWVDSTWRWRPSSS
jgi:hypothetical protein